MAGEIVGSVEMLRRLVAFDTTSRNSNLALIEYVQKYLQVNRTRHWRGDSATARGPPGRGSFRNTASNRSWCRARTARRPISSPPSGPT